MTQTPDITPEAVAKVRKELMANCDGHPYAKVPWPHRVFHKADQTIDALAARLAEVEAERDDALEDAAACIRVGKRNVAEVNKKGHDLWIKEKARAEAAEARIEELEAALPAVKVKSLVWDSLCAHKFKDGSGEVHCKTSGLLGFYYTIYETPEDGIHVSHSGGGFVAYCDTLEAAKAAAQADCEARVLSALDLPAQQSK